jgi:hypothetical protein
MEFVGTFYSLQITNIMADLKFTYKESGSKDSWVVLTSSKTLSFKKELFPTIQDVQAAMQNENSLELSKSKTLDGFYFVQQPVKYQEFIIKKVNAKFSDSAASLAKVREELSDFDLAF